MKVWLWRVFILALMLACVLFVVLIFVLAALPGQ